MKLKLRAIKTGELIAPASTLLPQIDESSILLVKALAPVSVEWRKHRKLLHPMQIVIGKRFRLFNPSTTEFVHVHGLVFHTEDHPLDLLHPVILSEHHGPTAKLVALLEYVRQIQSDISSIELPHEIELQVSEIFRSLKDIDKEETVSRTSTLAGKIDSRLIMINRYIRQHYHQPLTLTDLADIIQCSPTYLSNTYSKVFNISPIKHLQNVRMEKATDLLQHMDISVGDVAAQLGYISNSQFSELFKRYHGKTPSEFRRDCIMDNRGENNDANG